MLTRLFSSGRESPETQLSAGNPAGAALPARTNKQPTDSPPAAKQVEPGQPSAILRSAEDLPNFMEVLTANGGRLALLADQQRDFAVLLLSPANDALILYVAPSMRGSVMASNLRSRIRDMGCTVAREAIASPDLIMSIYDKANAGKAGAESSEQTDGKETVSAASKLFDSIASAGIGDGATDIHVCIRENSAAVLYRIHGRVYATMHYNNKSREVLEAMGVAFNKLAEQASRSDTQLNPRQAQNCVIDRHIAGHRYRFRFQTIPVVGGMDVIIRILRMEITALNVKSLGDLGYTESQIKELSLASRRTIGLIAIAGVTGSGKTTTLNTLMTMNADRKYTKVYTIEDPVEYRIYGASQISIQRDTSEVGNEGPMIAATRVVMRADPDTVMVGEVRDREMGNLLVSMVQTGHRVLTSIHASSAIRIVSRLTGDQIGLSRQAITDRNFVSVLAYQKLIPALCPHCKVPASKLLSSEYLNLIKEKFAIDVSGMQARNESGCKHCRHGIVGQTVAAEIVTPTLEILELMREGRDADAEVMWRCTRTAPFDSPDMTGKTAFEHALYKALNGEVDPQDLEAEFEPFERYIVVPTGRQN